MNLKVKIYQAMPAFVKRGMTNAYIRLRKWREKREAGRSVPQGESNEIQVAYLSGFPRSGTTVLKYYFGSHQGLKQTAFNPIGFFDAWKQAKNSEEILVDKSNHYIYAVENLFASYGRAVRLCVIIRDPRDCLVSFTRYDENREVPRNARYWSYWSRQHADLIRFAEESEFGDCLMIVRYEDFVRHPEESKAAFLNWLGLEVSSDELDRRYSNQNPDEGWHDSVQEYREVSDHALQKWKKMTGLPKWAESLLPAWKEHAEARNLMQTFGYDEEGFTSPGFAPQKCQLFRPAGN